MKSNQIKALKRLLSKKVPRDQVISPEMARTLSDLSFQFNRQIGVLIHRSGKVESVIVGDFSGIMIPQLGNIRTAGARLRGLRLVHTHLSGEEISDEDLMDLLFLRLDLLSVLKVRNNGLPDALYSVHLLPSLKNGENWAFLDAVHPAEQKESCEELISALEAEFARVTDGWEVKKNLDRAILVSVTNEPKLLAEESLTELVELSRSDNILVLDTLLKRQRKINPRFIIGKGKLSEIMIKALQLDANLLIFNQEMNPSQIRSITDFTDLRVIDRTQLILDIFAHRAMSREGKLQVEMAQLKYMLPRLSSRDDALSRLTGGIGARGPGETKLEIDRRRINDRLSRLAKELKKVSKERYHRRSRRRKKDLPVISLVGYTNAGKSTLLNSLTDSAITAENKLFATLDPTSRRLKFPEDREVIITDTVGFIRDLPEELLKAFKATLEELREADLLVHVIDISNPAYRDQVDVVKKLLVELKLADIPCLKVFNKIDRIENIHQVPAAKKSDEVHLSALDVTTFAPFLKKAQEMIGRYLEDWH